MSLSYNHCRRRQASDLNVSSFNLKTSLRLPPNVLAHCDMKCKQDTTNNPSPAKVWSPSQPFLGCHVTLPQRKKRCVWGSVLGSVWGSVAGHPKKRCILRLSKLKTDGQTIYREP